MIGVKMNNILSKTSFVMLVVSLSACVAPPDFAENVELLDQASSVTFALEGDVAACNNLNVVVQGGGKAKEVKDAVKIAMKDARNKALSHAGNRLVYADTKYWGYFGVAYVGIESNLYHCEGLAASVEGQVGAISSASAEAEAQKQAAEAAARAASQAAMQQAIQQSVQAAQHQQAMQNAQQAYESAMGR